MKRSFLSYQYGTGDQLQETFEITPLEALSKLKQDSKTVLLDVREQEEFALSRIEGSTLVPMQNVPAELQRLEALADEGDVLVLCHHGVRSLQVAVWLRARGIENAYSIAGGIDRWSREVDPAIARY